LKRVYEAVGVADAPEDPKGIRAWLDSGPPHWRACMAAIPGECTRGWRPATAPGQAVASALRDVERDTSPLVRCAALAWLLDRAVDAPHYVVGGLRRDLRDDLPPRLASAFAAGTHPRSPHAALEAVLLRHAAWLTRNDDESGAVLRTWAVARWLRGCLLRSPFFGGDAEALVARLLALLPVDVTVPADADPLHPGRFRLADGPDRNGLDLGDVAFVGAVAQHYRRQAGAYLKPTPVPVVDRLVALASRTLDPAEEAAETHLHTSDPATEATDGLGWGHRSLHVAPPLVARWLLSYLGVAWLHRAGEDAQRETLLRLGERPEAHEWATRAFHEEGPGLPPEVRAMGAATWRSLADAQTLRNRWLAMLAGGLLGDRGLDEAECLRAVGQAAAPDPDLGQDETDWRPFVLGSLAQRAEAAGMTRAWAEAVDRLLDLMEHTAETETCLNSALWALRRLARAGGPEALVRRTRFAELAADPPFSDHLGLRREMRRLRLLPDADRLRGTG